MPGGGLQPRTGSAQGGLPSTAPHHVALQRLAENVPSLGFGAEGPLQAFRDRRLRLRQQKDRQQQEEVFEKSTEFLLAPQRWTYGSMAAYQRKLLELMGATGWRRRLSADDPSVKHLEKELTVLEAMTPVELASNHRSVFTTQAKKFIAEKAGTTVKFVDQVLLEHDILRADRRWYMIRMQFNQPLPKSFDDRQMMAEYDRPLSETEKEMRQEMIEKMQKKTDRFKPKRIDKLWFRHPTCGGNRWSMRPPRWFPSQWKMRPDRRRRLAGVGVPGGGGDRGRPWGNLARFHGGGKAT